MEAKKEGTGAVNKKKDRFMVGLGKAFIVLFILVVVIVGVVY